MTNPTPKKRVASFAQVVTIGRILSETVLKRDDGFVEYAHGNSDETIASTAGVSITTVRNMRQQLYGRLRPFRLTDPPQDAEVAVLRDKIHEITDYLESLNNRLLRLEAALT